MGIFEKGHKNRARSQVSFDLKEEPWEKRS